MTGSEVLNWTVTQGNGEQQQRQSRTAEVETDMETPEIPDKQIGPCEPKGSQWRFVVVIFKYTQRNKRHGYQKKLPDMAGQNGEDEETRVSGAVRRLLNDLRDR